MVATTNPVSASSTTVVGPDGSLYEVPNAQMGQLPEGASVATPEQIFKYDSEKKYGGFVGGAEAAGAGLARGLTFGGSDVLGRELGVADTLKGLEVAHPVASTAGELASFAVPGLGEVEALGRGAQVAKAISAPLRGVMAAGKAVEGVAARALGKEATTVAGRVGQAALAHGAGDALVGAAFGASQSISDDAINDHDQSAEKVLAGAAHGAVLNGVFGAGLGAAGKLGEEAYGGLAGFVAKKMEGTNVGEWLEKQALKSTWRGIQKGAAKGATTKADRSFEGGHIGVAKNAEENASKWFGKRLEDVSDEELISGSKKAMEESGERIGAELRATDEAAVSAGRVPSPEAYVADVRAIAEDARSLGPGQGSAAKQVDKFADEMEYSFGIKDKDGLKIQSIGPRTTSYETLHKYRQAADQKTKFAKLDPRFELMYKVRSMLERDIEKGIGELSGKDALEQYLKAKQDNQTARILLDAGYNRSGRGGGNLGVTLTGKLTGMLGASLGSVAGPIGSAIGAGSGMAGAAYARNKGEFVAAKLYRKLKNLSAIERIEIDVDKRITDGVGSFLRSSRAYAVAHGIRHKDEDVDERTVAHISAMARNPEMATERIDRAIGTMKDHAPSVSAVAASKLSNGIQFLDSKAPKPKTNGSLRLPQMKLPKPTQYEMKIFKDYYDGVTRPLTVLDDLHNGVLSRRKVEALQATSPSLLAQIREEAIEQCAEPGNYLSYDKRLQLGILLGVATDETLTKPFLELMQKSVTQPASKQETSKEAKGGSRRPLKMDTSVYQSGTESTERREI